MNPQLQLQLRNLATIVFVWTLVGAFLSLHDHLLLISHLSAGPSANFSWEANLLFGVVSGFVGGTIGGAYLIFVINKKFRSEPYIRGVIAVAVGYVIIVLLITLLISVLQVFLETGSFPTQPQARERFIELILTTMHVKNTLFWAFIVVITQMTLQINDKFGPGLLWSMMTGKYHFPRTEKRIFMFLDLKSSTTIAEKLGNEAYHQFLKEVFADITDPILNSRGNIYQYVGDEVIISWNMEEGKENRNCITCFFEIRKVLQDKKAEYESEYGVMPEFKAGIHFGEVIAGEIGIIKRDITYSGDVLNTTARIQSQCNEHQSLFLSSRELTDYLDPEGALGAKPIGSIPLKGKEENVDLVSLASTSD